APRGCAPRPKPCRWIRPESPAGPAGPPRRASTAAPEHLPEHIGEASAAPRTAADAPSVRQHLEHDGHQRHQHLAHARASARRPGLLPLTATLSGQSTEKIIENAHENLPVAGLRRRDGRGCYPVPPRANSPTKAPYAICARMVTRRLDPSAPLPLGRIAAHLEQCKDNASCVGPTASGGLR